jgi:hypothetical protein
LDLFLTAQNYAHFFNFLRLTPQRLIANKKSMKSQAFHAFLDE